MGAVGYNSPYEIQKHSPRNALSLFTPTTPYLLTHSNDWKYYHLPMFPMSNLAHLSTFPLALWMTQDSFSCQKTLFRTITCTVSAAVRGDMSCSPLILLSQHLFYHSIKSQSLYVKWGLPSGQICVLCGLWSCKQSLKPTQEHPRASVIPNAAGKATCRESLCGTWEKQIADVFV